MKQKIWLTGLLLLFLVACNTQGPTDEPPEIAYGRDVCDACGMIIDEARFAASYVTITGEVRRFESIEDMLSYHEAHQEKVHLFWVHNYESEEWVRADGAFFVQSEMLQTPMGGGLIAAATEAQAQALALTWHGDVLTFTALLEGDTVLHSH